MENFGNKRNEFAEKIKDYLSLIERSQKGEQNILAEIENGHAESALLRLRLVEKMLALTSVYLAINNISQTVLKKKDENALNNARKSLGKCLSYLESVVTKTVDAPFSTYEKEINEIATFSPADRYLLIQKICLTIDLLKNEFKSNPKWKWSIVEFDGRLAVVAKNIINLRDLFANCDLRSPHYEPTVSHLRLAKKLLMDAADRYREKYEIYSSSIDDFKMATIFLTSLVKFDFITGDQVAAADVKKKLVVWNNKLNMDIKKQESKRR